MEFKLVFRTISLSVCTWVLNVVIARPHPSKSALMSGRSVSVIFKRDDAGSCSRGEASSHAAHFKK